MNTSKYALLLAASVSLFGCTSKQRQFSNADSGAPSDPSGTTTTTTTVPGWEAGIEGDASALDDDVSPPGDSGTELDDDAPSLDDDLLDGPSTSEGGTTGSPNNSGGAGGAQGGSSGTSGGGTSGSGAGGMSTMLPIDGGASGAGGQTSSPGELLDGTACTSGLECSSGYCVDGVCCESPCADTCSECAALGTEGLCTATSFDASCGDLQCPSDTECRTYDLADDANCADVGECLTAPNCDSDDTALGTACQSGAGTCDGAGECVVPDKSGLGESCGADGECGSGHCAAMADGSKVCCNETCNGTCQACAADGFCDAAPADDSRCVAVSCAADTTCADYPPDLTSNRCAGFGQCATSASYCRATYAGVTTSCGTGKFCDGAGACEDACTSSQLWCSSSCINPNTDEQNCGACGEVCPGTSQCVSGDCECQGATEQICGSACIDVSTNLSNCGSCDNNCPSVSGSTRTCKNGVCGSCGAYSEECCGTSTCNSGLSCSGGTCQCASGSHRCTSTNTCASDTDTTKCGSSCVDCRQPNAVATCNATGCANTCASGIVTLCPAGSDGKPSCGAWSFESNTVESWKYDLTIEGHASTSAPSVGNEAPASGGTRSLAVQYDPDDGYQVWVTGQLCSTGAPVNISNRSFSVQIMLVTAPDSPGPLSESTGSIFPLSYSGPGNPAGSFAVITNLNLMNESAWTSFTYPVNTMYGAGTTEVTHIGFNISASDWKGTVYIDRFEIKP